MEFSLHRQLKQRYATGDAACEVRLGRYRIDVVRDELLIEVQHGSLAAIRGKVAQLLKNHHVLVVKPIVYRKRLCTLRSGRGGRRSSRMSPKRGTLLDVFQDLVYFTRVFPHPRLAMELVAVDVEESRRPSRKRRRRRWRRDFEVEDQKLLAVHEVRTLRTAEDLRQFVPPDLPTPFHTGQLAEALGVERWVAQQIAYCFRKMGTAEVVGKQRGAWLYEFATERAALARAA